MVEDRGLPKGWKLSERGFLGFVDDRII